MLRANVGLSRKLSKDYNSTGYSINLDGEITAPVSDPQAVIEQVKELFDLAEEALEQQLGRSHREESAANNGNQQRQPQPPAPPHGSVGGNGNGRHGTGGGNGSHGGNGSRMPQNTQPPEQNNGHEEPPATNKQIQYLLSIGKRQKLSTVQLEKKIADILGRPVGVYDLTKQAAGIVIDALTNSAGTNGARTR